MEADLRHADTIIKQLGLENANPPSNIKQVLANCFKTGNSKSSLTPPIKNHNKGKIINKPIEI